MYNLFLDTENPYVTDTAFRDGDGCRMCDVYVGGKVRVSEFMIFLDLQHCGSK